MYEAVLFLHNLVRWVVLAFGFLALWRPGAKEGAFFAHALTLQVVLGILLAFVSPLFQGALANLEAVMQTPGEARYFVAEHWVGGACGLGPGPRWAFPGPKGKAPGPAPLRPGPGAGAPFHSLVPAPSQALA